MPRAQPRSWNSRPILAKLNVRVRRFVRPGPRLCFAARFMLPFVKEYATRRPGRNSDAGKPSILANGLDHAQRRLNVNDPGQFESGVPEQFMVFLLRSLPPAGKHQHFDINPLCEVRLIS